MIAKSVLFVFCTALFLTGEAKAQLLLEDSKKVLAVSGGEHVTGTLLIHNTGSTPAEMRVYWEDFEYKPPYDGSKNFLPAGTAPGSASTWVDFSPQTFTMPGMGQQYVNYTVSVPSTINEGHYGVIFLEKSAETLKDEGGVSIISRVGCLFFIEPGNKSKKAVLQDIALKPKSLTASFVNQGNVILMPKTTYYIMEDGGMVLHRGEANKLYLPAGATGTLEIPLKDKLKQGKYTLVVNCDLEDGDVLVKEIGMAADASGQLTITNS